MDFAEAKRTAPPVPGETCPIVDRLSTFLDALAGDIETIRQELQGTRLAPSTKGSLTESLVNVESGFGYARELLERLRADNEQLREGGRHWYTFARDSQG